MEEDALRISPAQGFLEHNSLQEFSQLLFGDLLEATKLANLLPEGDDYAFYASFRPFRAGMQGLSDALLGLSQEFIRQQIPTHTPIVNDPLDPDDVTDRFSAIVDVVDTLLERVDSFADEASGQGNKPKVLVTQLTNVSADTTGRSDYYLFHGSNVLRPQLHFKDPADNSNKPWQPWALRDASQVGFSSLPKEHSQGQTDQLSFVSFPHPFYKDIASLEYTREQLEPAVERSYKPLDETPFTWIDTEEGLSRLACILDQQTEFAVDLEHHSYRSFQGFVCLMQISTRSEDYIVDTLALRHHMHMLESSFHNPAIVKVYHGSDMDVLWQQKDFGLYIFNMFDTGQATRVLEFPSFSLAYLLKLYCNVSVDKKYQLADWRIRPLPQEMLRYAREDTHYLLYIYDRLRNELIDRGNMTNNLLLAVLNRSKDLCLQRYEKELWTPTAHLSLYNRHNFVFTAKQMAVFAALFRWRDSVAREEDESVRYVLPNHMLFHIAEVLPGDVPQLLACCNPVPPLVRLHADALVALIQTATDSLSITLPHHRPLLRPMQSFLDVSHASPSLSSPRDTTEYQREGGSTSSLNTPTKQEFGKSNTGHAAHTEGFQDSLSSLATSPVLSKEQLYSVAGWESAASPRARQAMLPHSSAPPASSLFYSLTVPPVQPSKSNTETVHLIHSSIATQSFYPTIPTFTSNESLSTEGPSTSNTKGNEDPAMKDVPRSIEEIYKISNRNRKRNKEKRKLKEESSKEGEKAFSPVRLGADAEQETGPHPSKRQKTADISDREFMRSIGWSPPVGNDGPAANRPASTPAIPASALPTDATTKHKLTKSRGNARGGPSSENFTPFDYSAVSPSHAFPSPAGRAARGRGSAPFNPYAQIDRQSRGGSSAGRGRAARGGHMNTFGRDTSAAQSGQWPKR